MSGFSANNVRREDDETNNNTIAQRLFMSDGQITSSSSSSSSSQSSSSSTGTGMKRRMVKCLVSKLSSVSEQSRMEAVCQLRLISKEDAESRPLITEAGAISYISDLLYSSSSILRENAAATLLNLSISNREPLMATRGLLDAISHTLRDASSSPPAVQSAAATLYSLLVVSDYRPIIGSKRDIIYALVAIIKLRSSPLRSLKDALRALFGISLYPLNRSTMVGLGVVPALFSLVVEDERVGVLEDATAVIAQVAGCEEGEAAFREVCGVGVLVELLDPAAAACSGRAKENAISALLNLVLCGGESVVDHVRSVALGVLNGIADVAERGTEKGRSKALDLLNLLNSITDTSILSSPIHASS